MKDFEDKWIEAQALSEIVLMEAAPSNEEYIAHVQSQLLDQEYVCSGMGHTSIHSMKVDLRNFKSGYEAFYYESGRIKSLNSHFDAFENGEDNHYCLPYKFTNKVILTGEVENELRKMFRDMKDEIMAGMKDVRVIEDIRAERKVLDELWKKTFVPPHIADIRYLLEGEIRPDIILIKSSYKSTTV